MLEQAAIGGRRHAHVVGKLKCGVDEAIAEKDSGLQHLRKPDSIASS